MRGGRAAAARGGVTDMKTPGLPVTYCNSAMVKLTGYPKEHTVGRNCRFLQGKRTEAAAVRVMVSGDPLGEADDGARDQLPQDGSEFVNVLTLHPVHDSENEYRYSIGILSDGAMASREERGAREAARGAADEASRRRCSRVRLRSS